ncbi:gliding motility lipoprotein GldD [Flavobacterium limnosediminis]|nr:gliding motility lipoprotein GldD [Flavobacterium limnosediminis]
MKNKTIVFLLGVFVSLTAVGCKDETVPKPKSHLRLEYPSAQYKTYSISGAGCGYEFEVNEFSKIKTKADCSMEIQYPKMKATVYLNYKNVNNNIDQLLRDAQKLTYEHVIKADDIAEQPFVNPEHKTYGMFYQVGGNAATNAQFYVTDSTRHFLVGSVYFYAKPNYDSILPAAAYIKNDMRKIMESVKWK